MNIRFVDDESEDEIELNSLLAAGEATAAALIRQEAEGGALLSTALLQCMNGGKSLLTIVQDKLFVHRIIVAIHCLHCQVCNSKAGIARCL